MDDSTSFLGGDRLKRHLADIEANLAGPSEVRVGFLEGATYPDGKSVPMVAAIQEWGGRIEREPSEQTIYRQTNATGTGFLRKGRFVRKSKSNFASTHYVGAYVITIPPRPFFRTMIKEKSPAWGEEIGKLLALGASTIMRYARSHRDRATQWQRGILARRPVKIAVLAQAAKTARIAWAMLVSGETYRTPSRVAGRVA